MNEILYERILHPDVYLYPDVDWILIESDLAENISLSKGKKIKYFECPIAFDIETTSFTQNGQKMACMYIWQLSINGHVILGRTWEEFYEVYERIVEMFQPNEKERVLIYIQNLPYEFQFTCHRFEWNKVFALKERKPLQAITTEWVEFRCSYALSGYSLEKIGENLQRYKIKKLVGDLDYDKMRHSKTPLTDQELQYCINDVQVIVAYITETAENDGGYHNIPLTKTGYVRNFCRKKCMKDKYYRPLMKFLTLTYDEYKQLKRAFAGGFTHANWHRAGITHTDVDSFDFTSSYPYVMIAEKFPMSPATEVKITSDEQFQHYLDNYCCIFDLEINELDGWDAPDHIISRSKCSIAKNAILNNGRVIAADQIVTTVTEVDYESLRKFYKWKNVRVLNFRYYEKEYLPWAFAQAILELYKDKTELKGVDGKEVEYLKSKSMINSAFGMAVTDIVRDEDTFIEEWTSTKPDGEEAIERYNNNPKRFLFYPWGVWVTAYARRNLYTGIYEFGDDYIYSDTDSLKAQNAEAHWEYIENYNKSVYEKLVKACESHRVDISATEPKTIKDEKKPLGIWDYEGHYKRFKTLGAKRYMVEDEHGINITVAGLNKKHAVPYMKKLSESLRKDMFDLFDDDLEVPGEHTGKQCHTYIDEEFNTYLTDYLGQTELVHEYSAVHLEPTPYCLSIDTDYINLIRGVTYEK